ncbi:oligopeptide transporter [Moniliophthora roreri MCA 2997]|uniref:Oligopeptide transporter n=1 Tax=Moniliophthora roreri (strain MCA 2997) TaxID=1381753 RepID=V2XSM4_MONRO|nr:oligopeptide transporter [Moniliophthora roreri MCA 2997]
MAGIAQVEALEIAAEGHVKEHEFKDEKASIRDSSSLEHVLDGIHDGLEFPTEEEKLTLRRVADLMPWNAYLIAIVEMAERFSFYGCSAVFTNFIQQPLPEGSHTGAGFTDGQSGALGLGQRASTGLTTFYQFWCYVTPLLGAYIADEKLGRYNTVCLAVFITLIGHILLVVAALPGVIEHKGAVGAFAVALVVMGLGTGMFKSNISPLIAEQYRRTKPFIRTEKSGERVIVDPALTIARVYMYFYLFINVGSLIGQIGMVYSEKYVGFWLAYTLPTIVFCLCPLVLWAGRNRYVRAPPTGSVTALAMRLWALASKGRWSLNPVTTWRQLRADDFWENVKPSKLGDRKPTWMNFDDQWVDEVNRGFKACAVFAWYPIFWLPYNQINNNLISQAATMTLHGFPNDVLSNIDSFILIIFIPIFDLLLYPGLRRAGIKWTSLKKITSGFFTGAAAMAWAAVIQHYIYKTNPCGYFVSTCKDAGGNAIVSSLNVWTQSGSYILIAFSEIFASITGLEYAFTKAPTNMRSLVMAVFLFTSALASALGEAFVALSEDPLLVWNYGSMGVLAAVAGVFFWFSVRDLDKQEDKLNSIGADHAAQVAVRSDEKA